MRLLSNIRLVVRNVGCGSRGQLLTLILRDHERLSGERNAQQRWARLKVRVLRRDRFRCRCCDRKGDEITLAVRSVRAGKVDQNCLLTLCVNCERIARGLGIASDSIPEFLRQLWYHLYQPM